MSKATFIELMPGMDAKVILDYFRGQGFVFRRDDLCVVQLGGHGYLDITQGMDDTGNGLGDRGLYLGRKARIDKQAERKRADGWSETKVRNWVGQKEREEIAPIEVGAGQWHLWLQGLLRDCRLRKVVLVVAGNHVRLGEEVFGDGPGLELSRLDGLGLILLEWGVRYGILN